MVEMKYFKLFGILAISAFTASGFKMEASTSQKNDPSSFTDFGIGTVTSVALMLGSVAAIISQQDKGRVNASNVLAFPQDPIEPNPLNRTILRDIPIPPKWSGRRIKSFDTSSTCLDAPRPGGVLKGKACTTFADSLYWTQQAAGGYDFARWFQFTTKKNGYGGYCIQAGIKRGYGQAKDGDKVLVVPCLGGEPTQIWTYARDVVNNLAPYKDLGSGKCLTYNKEKDEAEMWECVNGERTQLWSVWP